MRHKKSFVLALALSGLLAAGAQAQEGTARGAAEEAVAVHSIATAARLCNLISESDLRLAANRMDRVHASQLPEAEQETYRILRGSESFRNMVFASALRRAQGGCSGELQAVWRDVESTLVSADLRSGNTLAETRSMGGTAR